VIRTLTTALALALAAALSCAAAWDHSYEGDASPDYPINAAAEVTDNPPVDTREIVDLGSGNHALHVVDTSINRSRYRVDLDSFVEAGTVETRQRLAASSDMNNIAVMMRQDTPGASAEIRVGYYDAGDGRKGLWNAKTGDFLGAADPTEYYKLRMVLDGAAGGRLYVNDSYFANLAAAPGASSRLAFGAGSTLGTGEVYVDYFRWKQAIKAGPGEPDDPADPGDLISPRITSLPAAAPDLTSVTITWTTDAPADSTVHWGTAWTCPNAAYDGSPVTNHSVPIVGLQMGTRYRFYVESQVGGDPDVARSGIQTFTTQDIFRISAGPFVRTSTDGALATVSWTTTMDGDSRLFFRLKGGTEWSDRYSATPTTAHALALTELAPNSAYEYYVLSTRPGSPDAQSAVAEFFTYVHSSVGSLLTNGDFELGNLAGWTVPSGSDPGAVHPGPWVGALMPHSGDYFLGADSDGGARNGTIYQSVEDLPPSDYIYATVWVYTYERGASGAEEHDSACCRVGIDTTQDPSGPINPDAASVRWSAPVFTSNSGPWTCIGVMAPRGGSTYATILLRHVQSPDGGLNVTCFDDAVLTLSAPVTITSGPTVTNLTPTSATVEWTTDVSSTSFVQFGAGTLADYQFADYYLDWTASATHTATLQALLPATTYVFQVGSASPVGLVLSQPAEFTTPMNQEIENPGFEGTDSRGRPTLAPWTLFQYDINQLPRFHDPLGQPPGGPIDGLVGPYPAGGPGWHSIACEPSGGSYFVGAFADTSNKNGGACQRVQVAQGDIYQASMRFLTSQDPIDGTHPASNTACAIAIDPAGGTDVLSPNLVWSQDKTSAVDGQWDGVSVAARASADVITVFCVVEERYADSTHLNALDSVTLEHVDPILGTAAEIKHQQAGAVVGTQSPWPIVTYARIPQTFGLAARLYVEEQDRFAGIRIVSRDPILWSDPPSPGDRVVAIGTLAVVAGEATLTDAILVKLPGSPLDVPPPLAIIHRSLGGGAFGIQPGVAGGQGLSNVGLLVTVIGKVTSGTEGSGWITDPAGNTCAYLDDGSGVESGISVPGIKIIADPIVVVYRQMKLGDTVMAVGVSSIVEVGGGLRPIVLVGDWSTIQILPQ
jgi:hypothetical protein